MPEKRLSTDRERNTSRPSTRSTGVSEKDACAQTLHAWTIIYIQPVFNGGYLLFLFSGEHYLHFICFFLVN